MRPDEKAKQIMTQHISGLTMSELAGEMQDLDAHSPEQQLYLLAKYVTATRAMQKVYFATKSPGVLEESKRLEKILDKACRLILEKSGGQKSLF